MLRAKDRPPYVQLFVAALIFVSIAKFLLPRVHQVQSLRALLFWATVNGVLAFAVDRLILYPYFRNPLGKGFPLVSSGRLWCFNEALAALMEPSRGQTALSWFTRFQGEDAIRIYDPIIGDIVMPMSPDALRDGLANKFQDYQKSPGLAKLYSLFGGKSVVFTSGTEYTKFKKAIHPLFSIQLVRKMHKISWDNAETLTDTIMERGVNRGFHDPWPILFRYVLDSAGEGLLSYKFQALGTAWDSTAVKILQKAATPNRYSDLYNATSLFTPPGLLQSLPTRQMKAVNRAAQTLRNFGSQILEHAKGLNQLDESEPDDVLRRLAAEKNLTDEDIVESILTFLTAGAETTSAALAWTLHLLTLPENVKYQAELRKELQNRFEGIDTDAPSHMSLANIPILHGIVQETLRLHPSVPLLPYVANKDTEMAGQFIPKGTTILYWIWALNRNPTHWGANAGSMDPYRWITTDEHGVQRLNKHGGASSNYGFMSFFHGPRYCIGKEVSKATIRAAVARLILDFEISRDLSTTLEPTPGGIGIVRPWKNLKLNFKPIVTPQIQRHDSAHEVDV
ncbi:hypothetical protein CBER1_04401 [Cercospora berteroae]|uniref:Cytochrome P450 n=1 Tax=Cercospora berteroae TaxID=357750 RepID=A0A2S6CCL3_9PEZI|nr:hypothetical protein CBER1_04401 [Cercospora berteroae]